MDDENSLDRLYQILKRPTLEEIDNRIMTTLKNASPSYWFSIEDLLLENDYTVEEYINYLAQLVVVKVQPK